MIARELNFLNEKHPTISGEVHVMCMCFLSCGINRIRTYKFSQWQQIYSLSPSPIWILSRIAENGVFETQTRMSNILSREFPNLSGSLSSFAVGKRIELSTRTLAQFSRLLIHHCMLPTICTPSQIRTDTLQGLNLLPLPLGYRSIWYSLSDSNRNLLVSKTNASSNWAKRANKKASRNKSGGFLKRFKLYIKQYKLSCQLFSNNLAIMRDYINFLCSCCKDMYLFLIRKINAKIFRTTLFLALHITSSYTHFLYNKTL